jgi:hypothetical protein
LAKGKKTGGRQAGTPNKATAEIKALAQVHGAAAVAELARISLKSKSDNARVAAIRELLDRAYGKAPQTLPEGAAGILAHLIIEDGYGQKRE